MLRNFLCGKGGPDIAPSEDELLLRARIDRMVDTIVCPPSYGAWQAKKDKFLLQTSFKKPPSAAEDAEHAKLTARVLAFSRTPEGRARDRIAELEWKKIASVPAAGSAPRTTSRREGDDPRRNCGAALFLRCFFS